MPTTTSALPCWPKKVLDVTVTIIAVVWGVFQLYTAYDPFLDPIRLGAVHLAFALTLVFIRFPLMAGRARTVGIVISTIEIVLTIATAFYICKEIYGLSARIGMFEPRDTIYGTLAVLLVIDGCRRVMGMGLVTLVAVFLAYAYLGHLIPGLAGHVEMSNSYIISHLFMSPDGIFGTPMMVAASYVMLFVLFGTFMEATDGTDLLMRVSQRALGWTRGGAAKMSVLVSSLFGTISGAAVANVVTVGSLTIPLMKRTGFSGSNAGGIEAAASTGGQIMPPVMGAAAFIMAAILGIPYADVALGAVIPAVLFYVSLLIAVDLQAKNAGIRGIPVKDLPKLKDVPLRSWFLLSPILLLVYLLMITGISATLAGLYTLLATAAVGFVIIGWRFLPRMITAFRTGAFAMLQVSIAVAAAGIIIGVIGSTGLDSKFSTLILQATAGNLLLTLIATAIAAIVLGMGMPTVGVYLILAILVAPALIDLGITPLAAHMFIFYFGIMSTITPPVAISAFAAAGLADSSPTATSIAAFRLAAAGFVIPFLFVYSPSLLFADNAGVDLIRIAAATLALVAMTIALAGMWLGKMAFWERCAVAGASALLVLPDGVSSSIAVAMLVLLFLWQLQKARRSRLNPI
ncbi:TRAP transporter, 4TM/12TM fusion protein [Pusillimonas sp. T7-7]|uniref:TRAP transporter permease n=1 Tax=Pusillimonas sp. (strain T7-7) TaxID=1007105 RepID=UPI00020847B4|nr:TRAP transporter fused permease subunit [Pusillimonas sp. T7-7]AEC21580.1 TRAP transporter, 4TM/12TM fusion protein [Pusillimonas sp. T7-7]